MDYKNFSSNYNEGRYSEESNTRITRRKLEIELEVQLYLQDKDFNIDIFNKYQNLKMVTTPFK